MLITPRYCRVILISRRRFNHTIKYMSNLMTKTYLKIKGYIYLADNNETNIYFFSDFIIMRLWPD